MNTIITLVLAVLGSTALSSLVIYFVTRHDNKRNLTEKFETLEKDTLRTQILLLILLRPEEHQEILTVSRHYFADLNGDWYLTSVFDRWCSEQNIQPEWFDRSR